MAGEMVTWLSSSCLGKGKSSWNRVSLVNIRRPQECESSLGYSLNVIAQPTHDPQLASEHGCQGRRERGMEECSLDKHWSCPS